MTAIEKRQRVTDPVFLEWAKTLPCVCCQNPESAPHHLIGIGDGATGSKADDYLVIPLCMKHHTGDEGVHRGYRMWERRWGSQAEHCVYVLLKAFAHEVITNEVVTDYLMRLEHLVGYSFIAASMDRLAGYFQARVQ